MSGENKKTILLVEDEAILAMTQKMTLENYGYNAIIVNSGEKAVEIINNTPNIQLILMDIDLGKGIDGTEAAALILKDHDIPVVFCSSHTEAYIVEKTEKITSYGYIVKSSSNTVLDASIKMAFKLFESNSKTLESEEQYSAAFNTSPYGITITSPKDGRFIKVNKAFTSITGYSHDEALIDFSINMGLWVNVEERNRVVQELMSGNKVFDQEFLFKKKTGEIITGLFSASLIKIKNEHFILSSINDISEKKLNEALIKRKNEELEATNEELHAALEEMDASEKELFATNSLLCVSEEIFNQFMIHSPSLIYIKDEKLRLLKISKNMELLLGKPSSELIGKDSYDLVPPEFAKSAIADDLKVLIDKKPVKIEEELNGRVFSTLKFPIHRGDGQPPYLAGFSIDITERKQAEEKLKKQLAEKELILKEVHHRIKNNIASVEGLLLLQIKSTTNNDVIIALQDALTRVQSMRVLYDKLLLGEEYQEVSIKNYTESLIAAIVAVFPESEKVTIEKQFTDFMINTKIIIPLGIIINELFTNIFKYAFKDKDSGQISIILDKTENHFTLTIQDNGNGIDERVNINKSPGFGLMIVRMLTESLKGTYTIENNNGTKSVLKFDI